MLGDRHVDAIVTWLPPPAEAFAAADIHFVHLLVAMPDTVAEGYGTPVPAAVLRQHPVAWWDRAALPDSYDYWTSVIADYAGPVTFLPIPLHDSAQTQILREVARGSCVSIVSESYWSAAPREGVTARPLDPPLLMPLRLAWVKSEPNVWVADLLSTFSSQDGNASLQTLS
jgi:hypothetical protein